MKASVKWTPKQKEALQHDIGLWTMIAAGTANDRGRQCACCQAFNKDQSENDCAKCPVAISTGKKLCWGTPYKEWLASAREAYDKAGLSDGHRAANARSKKAAMAMAGYLEKVLKLGTSTNKSFKKKPIKGRK